MTINIFIFCTNPNSVNNVLEKLWTSLDFTKLIMESLITSQISPKRWVKILECMNFILTYSLKFCTKINKKSSQAPKLFNFQHFSNMVCLRKYSFFEGLTSFNQKSNVQKKNWTKSFIGVLTKKFIQMSWGGFILPFIQKEDAGALICNFLAFRVQRSYSMEPI